MTRTRLTAVLIGLLIAGGGLYFESGASQRRQPQGSAPQPEQPAQPRQAPAPQAAQPRQSPPPPSAQQDQQGGRTKPPDAPVTGRAEPRPPSAPQRPGPGRPGHGVVGRYPGPWYGWYGYPWYPYTYPWGYPFPPASIVADWASSDIRLDVTPKDASVHVDGYYAGIVDDFDGVFQSLTLPAGQHLLEIRKEGYHTLVLEVNLQPGQSIRYKRTMEPAEPGVAAPEEEPASPEAVTGDPEQFVQIPGNVRFDVSPKDTEVYADGYYAGLVDDFSGGNQRLVLLPGPHHIELRARGYETVEFDVNIRPGQTMEYRTSLQRSK